MMQFQYMRAYFPREKICHNVTASNFWNKLINTEYGNTFTFYLCKILLFVVLDITNSIFKNLKWSNYGESVLSWSKSSFVKNPIIMKKLMFNDTKKSTIENKSSKLNDFQGGRWTGKWPGIFFKLSVKNDFNLFWIC